MDDKSVLHTFFPKFKAMEFKKSLVYYVYWNVSNRQKETYATPWSKYILAQDHKPSRFSRVCLCLWAPVS